MTYKPVLLFEFDEPKPTPVIPNKKMTAKAALCKYLLDGFTLNIKNCFKMIGLTNCPREISRMIEQPFGVIVSRTTRQGHSRYGQPVTWVNYHLNKTDYNADGIEKMKKYISNKV
jgi:hypothetical protein